MKIRKFILLASTALLCQSCGTVTIFKVGVNFSDVSNDCENIIESEKMKHIFTFYDGNNYVLEVDTDKTIKSVYCCEPTTFDNNSRLITNIATTSIVPIYYAIHELGLPNKIDETEENVYLSFTSIEGDTYQYIYNNDYLNRNF